MKVVQKSRSLRGNVDRNIVAGTGEAEERSRSLRGNVDRNFRDTNTGKPANRRSLRGNVDRNDVFESEFGRPLVVPYVGTWIEIQPK